MYYWVCQKCDLKVWGAENCWCGINREQNSALAEKRYNEKKGTQKMDKHYAIVMEWSSCDGRDEGNQVLAVSHTMRGAKQIFKTAASDCRRHAIERNWDIVADNTTEFFARSNGYAVDYTCLSIKEVYKFGNGQ